MIITDQRTAIVDTDGYAITVFVTSMANGDLYATDRNGAEFGITPDQIARMVTGVERRIFVRSYVRNMIDQVTDKAEIDAWVQLLDELCKP